MEDFDGGSLELAAQMNRAEHIARAKARALDFAIAQESAECPSLTATICPSILKLHTWAAERQAESGHEHVGHYVVGNMRHQ